MAKNEVNDPYGHIDQTIGDQGPQCCSQMTYELTESDLPMSCPPRDMRVWDGHPRIYLPIEDLGKVVCPYCGAKYVLKDFVAKKKE